MITKLDKVMYTAKAHTTGTQLVTNMPGPKPRMNSTDASLIRSVPPKVSTRSPTSKRYGAGEEY